MTLCVYRSNRILIREEVKQSVIIAEESAHIIWNKNEYEICFKVYDIIRHLYPNISMTDLYNMEAAKRYKE